MSAPAAGLLTGTTASPWHRAAAGGLVLAGIGHLLAALDHLAHDGLFTGFFLVVGLAQMLVAGRLLRRRQPAAVAAALAATVALLLLYVYSRTAGLLIGPHADRPEDPDPLGTVVVVCELVAVTTLPTMLGPRGRRLAVNALLAVGVLVWAAWLAGFLG